MLGDIYVQWKLESFVFNMDQDKLIFRSSVYNSDFVHISSAGCVFCKNY